MKEKEKMRGGQGRGFVHSPKQFMNGKDVEKVLEKGWEEKVGGKARSPVNKTISLRMCDAERCSRIRKMRRLREPRSGRKSERVRNYLDRWVISGNCGQG